MNKKDVEQILTTISDTGKPPIEFDGVQLDDLSSNDIYQLGWATCYFTFKGLLTAHFEPSVINCGYACGYQEPFGFIPEADCPIHGVPIKGEKDV